jgi:protein required for attachment to host cells
MLNQNTLVIVAYGESAEIWRNHGHAAPDLVHVETVSVAEMAADGPAGAFPEGTSPHELKEASFIKHLVHKLNAMALTNELPDEVVIIADPSSLGQMRPLYHGELKRRIVRELPKTLVKATKKELEKALS